MKKLITMLSLIVIITFSFMIGCKKVETPKRAETPPGAPTEPAPAPGEEGAK